MPATQLEKCANCDAAIGKLETPHLWKDQTVCGPCHAKLSVPPLAAPPSRPLPSLEEAVRPSTWSPAKAATHPTFKPKGPGPHEAALSSALCCGGLVVGILAQRILPEGVAMFVIIPAFLAMVAGLIWFIIYRIRLADRG